MWTRSKVRLRKSTTERLECRNSFQALAEVQVDEKAGLQGAKDSRKVDATSLPGGKVLVVGDSTVMFLEIGFFEVKIRSVGQGCVFLGQGLGM